MDRHVRYDSSSDILTVKVQKIPCTVTDVFTSHPIKSILDMTLHKHTGALIQFNITGLKSNFDDDPPDSLRYNADEDTLHIWLDVVNDDGSGMCDLVYCDHMKNILITLNRNRVGNLTGIEIVGIGKLLETSIDISKN